MKYLTVILVLGVFVYSGFAQLPGTNQKHVMVQLDGDAIRSAGGVLEIQDTVATTLAIGEVTVAGQSLWIKKSEKTPQRRGVVHYWYDSKQKRLFVRFSPQDLPNFQGKAIKFEVVGINGPVSPGIQVKSLSGNVLPVILNP